MTTARKYNKIQKQKDETPANEIRLTGAQFIGKYISYAAELLLGENKVPAVVLKATGIAVRNACLVAEILRQRIVGLHQLSAIKTITVTDEYEPLEEELDHVKIDRFLAVLEIHLSTTGEGLDVKAPGYQAPLPKDKIQEQDLAELLRGGRGRINREDGDDDRRGGRRGRGRGGRRGGRGRGGRGRGNGGYRVRDGEDNRVRDHEDGDVDRVRDDYRPRGQYRPRGGNSGYRARDGEDNRERDHQDGDEDRVRDDYRPRGQYRPRGENDYRPRGDNDYRPRGGRGDNDYRPRGNRGDYDYKPRGDNRTRGGNYNNRPRNENNANRGDRN